ncbi:MAG: translation initiation factor IF-3 [Candidatus Berkelbacteria bacterium]|nr:translation initiation factor IF-3 [Candidatus Berkelbacteria bacterium]
MHAEDGANLGAIPTKEALNLAYEKGLDLVEINPTNRPPICKIMDFGRYKYDLAKKEKEARAKHKETILKEIRLTFKIGDHDIEYKAKQARDFFDDGNQIKVSMRLRGRENALVPIALEVFKKFATRADLSYERPPVKAGNQIVAMMTEKKEEKSE